jgi:dCTP deaminase
MILTGDKILQEVKAGRIIITPFDPKHITTNSYDFHLGNTLLISRDVTIDPKKPSSFDDVKLTEEGYVLQPNQLYLGHTEEIMGSDVYVPIIRGRSTTGRMGLFVHITADLIDIGSISQWTLMLHATQPVKIYPGMSIGQVTFWVTSGKVNLYTGKYKGLEGPQASRIYQDFKAG